MTTMIAFAHHWPVEPDPAARLLRLWITGRLRLPSAQTASTRCPSRTSTSQTTSTWWRRSLVGLASSHTDPRTLPITLRLFWNNHWNATRDRSAGSLARDVIIHSFQDVWLFLVGVANVVGLVRDAFPPLLLLPDRLHQACTEIPFSDVRRLDHILRWCLQH